jgi:hypothetical protein
MPDRLKTIALAAFVGAMWFVICVMVEAQLGVFQ